MLVLVFLSCAYLSTEAQSETEAAEKLVGFHKKLQQVSDYEPVKFLPPRGVYPTKNYPLMYVQFSLYNIVRIHFDD